MLQPKHRISKKTLKLLVFKTESVTNQTRKNESCTGSPPTKPLFFHQKYLRKLFLLTECPSYRWRYLHCVKSVQIRSYFRSVFSCIRAEYRKIRTRNKSVFGRFSRSVSDQLTSVSDNATSPDTLFIYEGDLEI